MPRGISLDGSSLRRLRDSKSLTQKDLAEAAGVSKRTIENSEAGRPITLSKAKEIAKALRVSLQSIKAVRNRPLEPHADPTQYLRDLLENTSYIDIRGLQVGRGEANRFPIEQLFISLTTPDGEKLDQALRNERLVVVGDPGAGKTTFLRRVAHSLCQANLGPAARVAQEHLAVPGRTFPILVRLSDLAQHLLRDAYQTSPPAGKDVPGWLPHYLGAASEASSLGLDAGFFRQQLEDGRCAVLLDGLDEAPDRLLRERMSRLIENATRAYRGCRFVVTSRPAAYTGEVVLPDFAHARIDPLSDEAIKTFLSRWCEAVYAGSDKASQEHLRALEEAIQTRTEIRRMAHNPVMLTALAVVHWNERRLPEQRADLYSSIIIWLSRSREQRPGRVTADRAVVLLQELALKMQDNPDDRKTQVSKRWAAERLAGDYAEDEPSRKTIAQTEHFLDEEEVDSGIIVGRGDEVAFWHLTFQEFLAAKAIASRLEAEQKKVLFANLERTYLPEWREVVLLLAGVLHQQGRAKVNWLIGNMFDELAQSPNPAAEARCSCLVANILRDLEPLKYKLSDAHRRRFVDAVMAIFDHEHFRDVLVEERILAADVLGQVGDPRIDFARDDYWVTIPAGRFPMRPRSRDLQKPNHKDEGDTVESPVHGEYLDSFDIARYAVTVGQYKLFIEAEGYGSKRWWPGGGFGQFSEPHGWERQVEFPSRPVVDVSWWEAAAFCRWSRRWLPTEAQWERVARGTERRKHPWGQEEPDEDRMNYNTNFGHATPVGVFPLDMTPEGVFDMGGNVWEWCADTPREFSDESASGLRSSEEAAPRVCRGCSWRNGRWYSTAEYRLVFKPDVRRNNLGFRVVAVSPSRSIQEQVRKQADPGA